MPIYDAIVLGTGGVGSAALMHIARRGMRVLGIDRFPPAHDRGSSHGEVRMIRLAYFEHPDYVPLLHRAYALWDELAARRGTRLYHEVGLLEVGPADGAMVRGVLESACTHGLEIEQLAPAEASRRYPGLRVPQGMTALFERRAGYLRVEDCVRAHLDEALAAGAELLTGVAVRAWTAAPRRAGGVSPPVRSGAHDAPSSPPSWGARGAPTTGTTSGPITVETDAGPFTAERLVITAGAWAEGLLGDLGLALHVRRKPQFWYETDAPQYAEESGCPAYFFELPDGMYYGFPQRDGRTVKFAEHSGGRVVANPLSVDRVLDLDEQRRVEAFAAACLPGVSRRLARHSVCMYTMTPDQHFVVDLHPRHPQVAFAAGLSGHGFKFTGVLGEALANLALDGRTDLPIGFLNCRRPGVAR